MLPDNARVGMKGGALCAGPAHLNRCASPCMIAAVFDMKGNSYDVSTDGRVLVVSDASATSAGLNRLRVVLNFAEDVRRRVAETAKD